MVRPWVSVLACLLFAFGVDSPTDAQERIALARPAFQPGAGPRILFDTAHWNPSFTEGRYHAVADLLRADGYRIVAGPVPFDSAGLQRYDLLFLVTPYATNPRTDASGAARPVFSEAESDALAAWVRAGGRLLLVVGHPPSGVAHANLARRFGVDLRNGTAIDATPANNWIEGGARCLGCLKFTLQNGLVRPHPITLGRDSTERVTSVISAAGQSLGVPDDHQVLLALASTAYDALPGGDTVSARGRAQAVAVTAGRGRVVVIGDGSILSGFAYGPENPRFRRWWPVDPDNRQFTLNVVRWLAGHLPQE